VFVTTYARGDKQDEKLFKDAEQGQIIFVSSAGELDSDTGLTFDKEGRVLKMDRLNANEFYGDSINFRGREIRNAHLVDSSIESLKHLTVDSLALNSRDRSDKHGHSLAVIDADGIVTSTGQMRWDEAARELKMPSLSSFSKSGLEIRSDVDFTGHQLNNANIAANTTLSQLVFKDGYIENSVLHNVTATGLNLGDVTLDSLSVTQFDSALAVGSMLVVGEGGEIEFSSKLKQEKDGHLFIDSGVVFTKSMDLNGQDILNANLRSGSIDGSIDVSVDYIKARSISLTDVQEDKSITSDGLAVIGLDGKLQMGPIMVDSKSGSLGNIKVHGTIDFSPSKASSEDDREYRGKIKDAIIFGGVIDGIEKLSVSGETELGSGLQVSGETYIDGSLTVSGSVLGSGPYIDVSDKRFKKNIEWMDSSEALEKILQLDGVSYELDFSSMRASQHRLGKGSGNSENAQGRQFGFIAQEVEKIFPEIVFSGEHDFKGLQYSRFAPIFVEGLKQLTEEVRVLQDENNDMKRTIHLLEERLKALEDV